MSAIKITIGIGTPRSKSKIERMRKPPDNIQLLQPLKLSLIHISAAIVAVVLRNAGGGIAVVGDVWNLSLIHI